MILKNGEFRTLVPKKREGEPNSLPAVTKLWTKNTFHPVDVAKRVYRVAPQCFEDSKKPLTCYLKKEKERRQKNKIACDRRERKLGEDRPGQNGRDGFQLPSEDPEKSKNRKEPSPSPRWEGRPGQQTRQCGDFHGGVKICNKKEDRKP